MSDGDSKEEPILTVGRWFVQRNLSEQIIRKLIANGYASAIDDLHRKFLGFSIVDVHKVAGDCDLSGRETRLLHRAVLKIQKYFGDGDDQKANVVSSVPDRNRNRNRNVRNNRASAYVHPGLLRIKHSDNLEIIHPGNLITTSHMSYRHPGDFVSTFQETSITGRVFASIFTFGMSEILMKHYTCCDSEDRNSRGCSSERVYKKHWDCCQRQRRNSFFNCSSGCTDSHVCNSECVLRYSCCRELGSTRGCKLKSQLQQQQKKRFLKSQKKIKNATVCLPQNASKSDQEKRGKSLQHKREQYNYDYETCVPQVPMLAVPDSGDIPDLEMPKFLWSDKFNKRSELISRTPGRFKFSDRPESLDSYIQQLWDSEQPMPKSAIGAAFNYDETFARYRLAGPNPTQIRPCFWNELCQLINLEYLDYVHRSQLNRIVTAEKEGRLFICDYSALAAFTNGRISKDNANYEKYSTGPIALFEIAPDEEIKQRQSIVPLAIQCERWDRDQESAPPPVFTPDDAHAWKIAKAIVNSADGDYHQAVVHLAHTHLLCEPFVIATRRQLAENHPLSVLLVPHFEGTAHINKYATYNDDALIAVNGDVGLLANQDIHELQQFIGEQVLDRLSRDFSFPSLIQERGMNDQHFDAPYPYRDDGMLIWDAIYKWVWQYLKIYYGGDNTAIEKDYELQNWVSELSNEGRVAWLDRWDNTFAMLVQVVAAFVFTASAHHAATNYPQADIECYVPAFPLAILRPPPVAGEDYSEQDYLNYLPSMAAADKQRFLGLLLGGIQYTTLGQYGSDYFKSSAAAVQEALKRFQSHLKDCATEIDSRNQKRVALWKGHLSDEVAKNWNYSYLLPANIPQSVNI